MNNGVKISDGKILFGVSNIVVSEIDGNIFINNTSYVQDSITGALACYQDDGSSIKGTGVKCVWDEKAYTLRVENIETKFINTVSLETKSISAYSVNADTFESNNFASFEKQAVNKWLGFHSKLIKDSQPFKISTTINPATDKECLIFVTNDINDQKSNILLALEDNRVYLPSITNIRNRTISTAMGCSGDKKGDIALDDDWLYRCVEDYDGINSIWKRIPLTGW